MIAQRESIPLVNLAAQSRRIQRDVLARIERVIGKANYILGEEVAEFEREFAAYCGVEHCVGLANGTDALHLALRALGIGPGDEVITAGNSFAATPLAILYSGATPVLVDVCEDDFNIDPEQVERAITPRTRAIIPVHLYGQPARMSELLEIAKRHGLKVIEDAAQAHGAEEGGTRCGAWGDVGCFSFYPGKNLGAFGDAGGAVTNDSELAERLRTLRNYGQVVKNRHDVLGFNCRMDTLQACVLSTKMAYIDAWTEHRREVARWYAEEFVGSELRLPSERAGARHVYHLYVARTPRRDALMQFLAGQGIHCGIHYPRPLSDAAPLAGVRSVPHGLPVCRRLAAEIISLPMCPEVTRAQVARIASETRDFRAREEMTR